MAKQSALPLLLVAGVAAVAMKKKKKKKKTSDDTTDETTPEAAPNWSEVYDPRIVVEGGGESAKMVLDSECAQFAEKLNYDAHNQYITGMFHDMVGEGVNEPAEITRAMLKDQAPNCPWDDQTKWTDLMKGLWTQLYAAVGEYAAGFPGHEYSTGAVEPD